ncbi:MAG: hypothetical protein IKF75_03615, partial [Lachnospiraceae bacterium]|nr:hypothetical protein [Lachnospiraceae bacterium]
YNLYPAPEGAYVGDVMPFVTDEGELELYYLYDTGHNGQGYHPIYKYSTSDFSGYTDHGMALNYGLMSEPDPALGTGCVMQDQNGGYHLFYTGHNDTGNAGKGKECVMHATSTDRENWTKDGDVLFYAPEGYSKDDFRDPEVFWVERDQCYWLLIAAHEETLGGVVLKYTSTDLKNWELFGPIFAPMSHYMCECPALFEMTAPGISPTAGTAVPIMRSATPSTDRLWRRKIISSTARAFRRAAVSSSTRPSRRKWRTTRISADGSARPA